MLLAHRLKALHERNNKTNRRQCLNAEPEHQHSLVGGMAQAW